MNIKLIFFLLLTLEITKDTSCKFIDLTHMIDENTFYWPTGSPFNFTKKIAVDTATYFYALNEFSSSEHIGTHLDAPYHFCKTCSTIEKIPIENFVTNGFLIDISEKCKNNPDYLMTADDFKLSKEDLKYLEGKKNFLVVHTGWGLLWDDREKFTGSNTNDPATFRFPGLGESASKTLVDSKLFVGVGIDTASTDYAKSTDYLSHKILANGELYSIENLANSHLLPRSNFTVFVFPMKIKGGTGSPARVTAYINEKDSKWDRFTEL